MEKKKERLPRAGIWLAVYFVIRLLQTSPINAKVSGFLMRISPKFLKNFLWGFVFSDVAGSFSYIWWSIALAALAFLCVMVLSKRRNDLLLIALLLQVVYPLYRLIFAVGDMGSMSRYVATYMTMDWIGNVLIVCGMIITILVAAANVEDSKLKGRFTKLKSFGNKFWKVAGWLVLLGAVLQESTVIIMDVKESWAWRSFFYNVWPSVLLGIAYLKLNLWLKDPEKANQKKEITPEKAQQRFEVIVGIVIAVIVVAVVVSCSSGSKSNGGSGNSSGSSSSSSEGYWGSDGYYNPSDEEMDQIWEDVYDWMDENW